jgi:hypothetical protein
MAPKSVAERVQAVRDRMKAFGFVRFQAWVHESDLARVKAFVERLAAKHKRPQP